MQKASKTNLVLLLLLASTLYLAQPSLSEPQSLSISIAIGVPEVKVDVLGDYDLISVPNLGYYLHPGAPIVPVKVVTLKLPLGSKVLGVEYSAKYKQLKGVYRVLPTPQPQRLDEVKKQPLILEDPSIYGSDQPYPATQATYEVKVGLDPFTKQRVTYVIIKIFPVRVVPSKGVVLYAESFDLKVSYIPGSQPVQQPVVNLVVITDDALLDAANALAQWKNSTGLVAKVYTVSWIASSFPGVDTPEKIRNFINYTVNNYGTLYVILLGDSEVVPARRVYDPSFNQLAENNPLIESDLYYADLQGSWDTNGNGFYGDLSDTIDGVPDVLVGRIPASSLEEASKVLEKLSNYQPYNSWLRRALLLGTVTFDNPLFPEGEILKDTIEENYLPGNFSWTKLYEGVGTLTPANVLNEINKGYGLVNFAGHGNFDLWYFGSGGVFFTSDVYQLANGPNASVVATMACLTADWADTNVSIGEAFVLHSGGAIAYLGSS